VRATEKLVSEHLNPDKSKSASSKRPANSELSAALNEVQERLRERLATQVQIKHGTSKGKIEIEYYGNDDLDRLLELMGVA
jgi:ParB family chromosome partitioning protein